MLRGLRHVLAQKVYYGWIITLACFLATVTVFGSSYSFSVFYGAFLDTFDASRSQIALVFGVQSGLIYLVGVGVARVIEYRGQRQVVTLSSGILLLGLGWAAFARSYLELFLALGIVAPIGMAGLYIVGWATLPVWFERRRGTAVSIAAAGTGVSLVVVPALVEQVMGVFGWRGAMLGLAGLMGALLVGAILLFVDSPAQVGADRSVEFGDAEDGTVEPLARDALQKIVFSTPFLLVLVGWLFIYAPFYVILSHVVLYATDIGVGQSVGVLALTIIGVMTTFVRLGIGPLADRVGRVTTFIGCSMLLGAASIGFAGGTTPVVMLGAAVGVGAGYGGAGGLLGAVTADLFGERSLNSLFGILSLSFGVSGLLAPPLAGLWYEYAGSYEVAFIVSGLVGVTGAGCVAVGMYLQNRLN